MQLKDKKIYFITNRKHNLPNDTHIITTHDTKLLQKFLYESLENGTMVGYDKETTGLSPFTRHELLDVFGNRDVAFVVDRTSVSVDFVNSFKDIRYIGHNIQFDCKFALYNGIHIINTYDTLLVERTLRRGLVPQNSLEQTYKRRCGKQYPVPKDTRNDFVGASKMMVFNEQHILYSAADNFTIFINDLLKHTKRLIKLNAY